MFVLFSDEIIKVSGLYIDVGYKTLKKIQILKLHVIDKQFFSKLRWNLMCNLLKT